MAISPLPSDVPPLHCAIEVSSYECVRLLIEQIADDDRKRQQGYTTHVGLVKMARFASDSAFWCPCGPPRPRRWSTLT